MQLRLPNRSLQLSVTRGSAPVNATDDKDETPTDDVTAPESKEKIARVDSEEEDDDGFLVVDNDDLDDADGEIREFFEAAVTFVSSVAMGGALTLSPKDKLQLYGLYKVATCGKCNIPKPSMFNPSALAKWEAWNKLGDLPRSEAMADYVSLLTLNCPGWNHEGEDADGGGGGGRAGGPVMSTFARDPADDEADADPQHCLHRLASMGDEAALREAIQEGGHDHEDPRQRGNERCRHLAAGVVGPLGKAGLVIAAAGVASAPMAEWSVPWTFIQESQGVQEGGWCLDEAARVNATIRLVGALDRYLVKEVAGGLHAFGLLLAIDMPLHGRDTYTTRPSHAAGVSLLGGAVIGTLVVDLERNESQQALVARGIGADKRMAIKGTELASPAAAAIPTTGHKPACLMRQGFEAMMRVFP
eukprot:jgi/Mesvir1/7699/Mv11660-RA.1